MGNPKLRPAFRLAMKNKDVVPKEFGNDLPVRFEPIITDNEKLVTGSNL